MHDVEQRLHRADEAVSHQRVLKAQRHDYQAYLWSTVARTQPFIYFYAAVLIEPQINPIKHFPVVLVLIN